MAETVYLAISAELKTLIGEKADKENLPLNEFIAKVLAERIGRPELGVIPRKKMGRPRKDMATAS